MAVGVRHRLAGDPVLPLDGLAVAEIRVRQRLLSSGGLPGAHRLEELCRRVRVQPLPDLFQQPPDRHRLRHGPCDAGRRAGGLRDCADGGAQIGDRDPDRAHHAGPVVSDPAVPAVPVSRPARHAG
ncbi:hypothetical protein NS44R_15035, partial [Mammaliicoccus sciuri]